MGEHMGIKAAFLAFLAVLLSCSAAVAAERTYSYTLLSPNDGYPSHVTSIFIDESGSAHLGSTSGLFRIRSNSFTKSSTVSEMPFNIPSDHVYQVLRDNTDAFWALTAKGVIGFSPRTGDRPYQRIDKPGDNYVAYSALAMDDCIYFAGENIIWRSDYATREMSIVAEFETDEPFITTQMIKSRGRILLLGSEGQEIHFLYPEKGQVTSSGYEWSKGAVAALLDTHDRLWIAKPGKGIECYKAGGVLDRTYNTSNSGMSNDTALCLMEKDGEIWVGTEGGGINIINHSSGEVDVIRSSSDVSNSIPSDFISSMFEDMMGNVWVGCRSGGAFIMTDNGVFSISVANISGGRIGGVLSMYYDAENDMMWGGTRGTGLFMYDEEENRLDNFPSTSDLGILSIAKAGPDKLALACPQEGIYIFDRRTGECSLLFSDIGKPDSRIFGETGMSIANDPYGRIIILSDDIQRYSPETGQREYFPLPQTSLPGDLNTVFGSTGAMFFDSGHLYRWNEALPERLEPVFNSDNLGTIHSAAFDRNHTIWFAVGEKIASFSLLTGVVELLDRSFDSTPQSVMFDTSTSRLWIGTMNSLYSYDTKTGNLLHVDQYIGAMRNEYISSAKFIDNAGYVYMGGLNGIVIVSPEADFTSRKLPVLEVDQILVKGKPMSSFKNLRISQSSNNMDVFFIARDPEPLREKIYRFVVDGPSGETSYEMVSPEFHFSSLNHGHYRIYGSCSTRDGGWTDMAPLLDFDIAAYWYLSWWFCILVVIFTIFVVLFFSHIVEEREKEEYELQRKADEERLSFLINVGHEIRTPLTVIMGNLNKVLRDLPFSDARNRRRLAVVMTQEKRIQTLIESVLTVNHFKSRSAWMDVKPVNINSWIWETTQVYQDEAESKGISMECDLDPAAGTVLFDPVSCGVVLDNIIQNALSHNAAGEPIRISSKDLQGEGFVRVSVRDSGPGIAEDDPSALFERYYKVTEEKTGFGVGLSYAKHIIDIHEGRIGAGNNPDGKGACFWFDLPVDR